jgi:hypothetical protein
MQMGNWSLILGSLIEDSVICGGMHCMRQAHRRPCIMQFLSLFLKIRTTYAQPTATRTQEKKHSCWIPCRVSADCEIIV